jgi:hypothetical protein
MLAETQNRLDELDARLPPPLTRENTDTLGGEDEYAEAQARAALHNLLFPDLPMEVPFFVDQYGNPHTSHHMGSSRNLFDIKPMADIHNDAEAESAFVTVKGSYSDGTVRPDDQTAHGSMPEWGSAVEIPDGDTSVPPPRFPPVVPPKYAPNTPVIHVQPPTTTATNSNGEARRGETVVSTKPSEEQLVLNDVTATAVPKPVRSSGAPSPPSVRAPAGQQPQAQAKQMPLFQQAFPVKPWDIVAQRLLSWALVWPAEDFIRSLKAISLGQQVCGSLSSPGILY